MEDNYHSLEGWFPDAFTHETETLTRVLQISLSTDADLTGVLAATGSPSQLVNHGPAASALALASDAETAPRRSRTSVLSPQAGKVSKRKTRPSKRSFTTFVVADPANFRQMVHRVTGIPCGCTHAAAEAVLRPEPQMAGGRVATEGSGPPTLDTSAFLLEQAGETAAKSSGASKPASFGSGAEGVGFYIDPSLPCFPTLESSGVL